MNSYTQVFNIFSLTISFDLQYLYCILLLKINLDFDQIIDLENERGYCLCSETFYNVDEVLLATMEEKYRIFTEEVARLEKDSQTVRLISIFEHYFSFTL